MSYSRPKFVFPERSGFGYQVAKSDVKDLLVEFEVGFEWLVEVGISKKLQFSSKTDENGQLEKRKKIDVRVLNTLFTAVLLICRDLFVLFLEMKVWP